MPENGGGIMGKTIRSAGILFFACIILICSLFPQLSAFADEQDTGDINITMSMYITASGKDADFTFTYNDKWFYNSAEVYDHDLARISFGLAPVKDSSKMESKINLEYKKAYSKAIAEGKSKQSARHEGWQKATGIAQAYWRKTLPKYGFEFVTPKKGYNYNGR